MLILTRKLHEAIQIGDNIRLKVLHISEGQVKLGIEAPEEIRIYRAEIHSEIEEQNVMATKVEKSAAVRAAEVLAKTSAKQKLNDA